MPVFSTAFAAREAPERLLSMGWYLPTRRLLDAQGALHYVRDVGEAGYSATQIDDLAAATQWTRAIEALNRGRKWPLGFFARRLEPMLAPGVALAVVPSHEPFVDNPPIRQLGRLLADGADRVDATGCLVRHTRIQRIVWGGPSYRRLHRDTIQVAAPEQVAGRAVLLLDDIVKSGASLRTCRELLYEAGASVVQALALGRVAR